MHHMLFDQNQPEDMRAPRSQMLEYSLVVPQKVCENKAKILHTHADYSQALQVSEGAQHYALLFQVIS
jgi:hypothetical protein